MARQARLAVSTGVQIISVEAAGPAAAAGLERGDIVIAMAGTPVTGVDDLHRLLTEDSIGRTGTIAILRGGRLLEKSITPVPAVA